MSLMKIDKDQVMVNGEYWVVIFDGSIFNQIFNDEFITSMMNDGMMISFIIMITHAVVPNY